MRLRLMRVKRNGRDDLASQAPPLPRQRRYVLDREIREAELSLEWDERVAVEGCLQYGARNNQLARDCVEIQPTLYDDSTE